MRAPLPLLLLLLPLGKGVAHRMEHGSDSQSHFLCPAPPTYPHQWRRAHQPNSLQIGSVICLAQPPLSQLPHLSLSPLPPTTWAPVEAQALALVRATPTQLPAVFSPRTGAPATALAATTAAITPRWQQVGAEVAV